MNQQTLSDQIRPTHIHTPLAFLGGSFRPYVSVRARDVVGKALPFAAHRARCGSENGCLPATVSGLAVTLNRGLGTSREMLALCRPSADQSRRMEERSCSQESTPTKTLSHSRSSTTAGRPQSRRGQCPTPTRFRSTSSDDARYTTQVVRVGIEGSGSYGRAIAIHLVASVSHRAVSVVEVPTLMTSRERGAPTGQGQDRPGRRCRDRTDHRTRAQPPTGPVDHRTGLRTFARLLDYREQLAHRTHRRQQPRPCRAAPASSRDTRPQSRPWHSSGRPPRPWRCSAMTPQCVPICAVRRLQRVQQIDAARSPTLTKQIASHGRRIRFDTDRPSTASDRSSPPGSWPRSSTSAATPTATPSPPPTAPLPCRPRQDEPSGTGSTAAATGNSTARSTQSRSPRSEPTPKAGPTTTANEPPARPAAKPSAASNDDCPTRSSEPCAVTSSSPPTMVVDAADANEARLTAQRQAA